MIKSLNESINYNETVNSLFEELEARPELSCSGQACGGNATGCVING